MIGRGTSNIASEHRFLAFDENHNVWNGSTFVEWDDADFEDYGIEVTSEGGTRFSAATPNGSTNYELWYWTGTLSTSYPVYEKDVETTIDLSNVSLAANQSNVQTLGGLNVSGSTLSVNVIQLAGNIVSNFDQFKADVSEIPKFGDDENWNILNGNTLPVTKTRRE